MIHRGGVEGRGGGRNGGYPSSLSESVHSKLFVSNSLKIFDGRWSTAACDRTPRISAASERLFRGWEEINLK